MGPVWHLNDLCAHSWRELAQHQSGCRCALVINTRHTTDRKWGGKMAPAGTRSRRGWMQLRSVCGPNGRWESIWRERGDGSIVEFNYDSESVKCLSTLISQTHSMDTCAHMHSSRPPLTSEKGCECKQRQWCELLNWCTCEKKRLWHLKTS